MCSGNTITRSTSEVGDSVLAYASGYTDTAKVNHCPRNNKKGRERTRGPGNLNP